jgi:hypothetical protein
LNSASTYSRFKASLVALVCVLWLVVGCDKAAAPAARAVPAGTTSAPNSAAVVVEAFPARFSSATATVNGTTLHYVIGGQGLALMLIHGFPEN